MKYSFSFIGILFLVLGFIFIVTAWIAPSSVKDNQTQSNGVVVVELFTSQGCSSCPKADALLKNIAEEAEKQELPIFALSFHVDYWDRLGWKDPFSQSAFTQRQRQYAQNWHNSQIYTPQMTINGREGFVGSRKQQAWATIEEELNKPISTSIHLSLSSSADEVDIQYKVNKKLAGHYLHLALVVKNTQNLVQRGENRGKTLNHTHVVRAFTSHSLHDSTHGETTFHLPDNLRLEDTQVIAYVQDSTNLKISGATMQPLVTN